MNTFFTSDLHFGHENIIAMDKRPFVSADEMNGDLISRWNNKVSSADTVYILGDLIWKNSVNTAPEIIKKLNGNKILIRGNHDTFVSNNAAAKLFVEIKDYADITVKLKNGYKRRCILSHYFIPFYAGYRHGAVHLHGHAHNKAEYAAELAIVKNLKAQGYNLSVFNVGCMHWNYTPVTLDEI